MRSYVKGRGCRGRALPRQLAWRGPIQRRNSFTLSAREGTSTSASVTAPRAGRFSASGCELAGANLCIDRCSFLPISLDRSCAAWRQDSVHTPIQPAMGSRASGRLSGCHAPEPSGPCICALPRIAQPDDLASVDSVISRLALSPRPASEITLRAPARSIPRNEPSQSACGSCRAAIC